MDLKRSPPQENTYRIFHEAVGGKKARGAIILGGVGVRSPEILMDLKRSPPPHVTMNALYRALRRHCVCRTLRGSRGW